MDFITLDILDKISAVMILTAVAVSVITDKLVWHTRLKRVEEEAAKRISAAESRADRWERVALEALQAGALAGVRAAETAVDVVSALPDPGKRLEG